MRYLTRCIIKKPFKIIIITRLHYKINQLYVSFQTQDFWNKSCRPTTVPRLHIMVLTTLNMYLVSNKIINSYQIFSGFLFVSQFIVILQFYRISYWILRLVSISLHFQAEWIIIAFLEVGNANLNSNFAKISENSEDNRKVLWVRTFWINWYITSEADSKVVSLLILSMNVVYPN